jgi:APA family basic amino acid/polyamine antiporter
MTENVPPTPIPPMLRRSLSLPLITLYGLGTTIGGGIYALVGKVAGRAGLFAPLSFLVAALLAAVLALVFAELASRFPKSAGEAVYVQEGFGRPRLAATVGWMVVIVGAISSAALANGFAGYVRVFVAIPEPLAIAAVVVVMGVLAAWGIGESVTVASIATVIEIAGLLLVVWAGRHGLAAAPARWDTFVPPLEIGAWAGILAGSFLAFYAFIGFEDMVNVAEEVTDVERTLPRAIVLTLVITAVLYLAVSFTAVTSVPVDELARSEAPLAVVYERGTGEPATAISIIALFAVVNGALIQIIMATRVLYGMSSQKWLPEVFARVHPKTQTPLLATALITLAVLALALSFAIETLAETTSLVILIIAAIVCAALWRVKRRGPGPAGTLAVPHWLPAAGVAVSLFFVALLLWDFGARIAAAP